MKYTLESSKKLLKKNWIYLCEYVHFDDILDYLKKSSVQQDYLDLIKNHSELFNIDVCIILDDKFLLYAKHKNSYYSSVKVINISSSIFKKELNDVSKGDNEEVNNENDEESDEDEIDISECIII